MTSHTTAIDQSGLAADFGADLAASRIGLIGAGRLGTALASALSDAGCTVAAVASRTTASAQTVAARIAGCRVTDAQGVADASDLVLVATPDDAIAAVADAVRWRAGMGVVHCSGATEVAVLSKAAHDGAWIGGFHPMQSFADPDAGGRALPGGTVTIEAEASRLDALLVHLATRLQCRVNRLPPGARGRYHAAAGYASQFVNVLLNEASAIWQSWGASEDDAVRALLPLLAGTIASIRRAGVAGGMPGPVSRGDVGTVVRHVQALAELPPEVLALYRALCERSVALALAQGSIDDTLALRFKNVLTGGPKA